MTTKSVPRTKREPKVEEAVTPVGEVQPDEPTVFETFMDHQRKAVGETGRAIESLLPEAFKEHSKAAVKETVEGYRQLVNSVLDQVIDQIEKIRLPEDKNVPQEKVPEP
jgi:hypothetical protein